MKQTLRIGCIIGSICLGGMVFSIGVGVLIPSPVSTQMAEAAWAAN